MRSGIPDIGLIWQTSLMIGRLAGIVIDCPDPRALTPFYEALLGAKRLEDDEDWVDLVANKGSTTLSLQKTEHFVAPDWTAGTPAQQLHLDIVVEDLDVAEPLVLALGATVLDGSEHPVGFRVYADPVGHPFCLVTDDAFV